MDLKIQCQSIFTLEYDQPTDYQQLETRFIPPPCTRQNPNYLKY